jgi:hypothetical protein
MKAKMHASGVYFLFKKKKTSQVFVLHGETLCLQEHNTPAVCDHCEQICRILWEDGK